MLTCNIWGVRAALFVILVTACLPIPTLACQIPVFRYALENWEPSPYLLVVAHRGELSSTDRELVEQLREYATEQRKGLNLDLKVVDLATDSDAVLKQALGSKVASITSPQMVLVYPFRAPLAPPVAATAVAAVQGTGTDAPSRTTTLPKLTAAPLIRTNCPDGKCDFSAGGPRLAWSGALTAPNVAQLVTSPARKEIANRLLAGHSAVWVVVESGDKAKDDAAVARLEKKLAQMEKELKLPDKQALVADEHYKPQTKVDLKIAFSVVRIPVQHDDEAIFVTTLLKSDPDVRVNGQPLAIAVFGQGRSYFPLVGDGIDATSVDEHCRFLTGDCSCEVKEANPGIDLLFAVLWKESITRTSDHDQEPAELSGIGILAAAQGTSRTAAEMADAEATPAPAKNEPATPASPNTPTAAAPATHTPAATATEARSQQLSLTWFLGPAAIGLVVVLLGTLWFRMGR